MKIKNYISVFIIITFLFSSCRAHEEENDPKVTESSALNDNLAAKVSDEADIEQQTKKIEVSRQNAITNAIRKCNPAIVGINVTEVRKVEYRSPFSGHPLHEFFFGNRGRTRVQEYEVQGLGSGFIISPDGYILTNHHVAGSASEIIITMTDGKEYEAQIIGSDMVTDVALLKIEGENFPYLELGNSDNIITGEWAIAFGNPFGLFDKNSKPTVTVGVVSNKGINFVHQDKPYNRVYRNMIQTDAAISSGNSGGPLVNAEGKVIAMNTVIFSTAQSRKGAGSIGIGFAVPINRVKKIVNLLKDQKEIKRDFFIGMKVQQLNEKLSAYLNIEKENGVVVFEMKRKGPADEAGLQLGDVILEINGYKIRREEDYLIAVQDNMVGDYLNFTILRDGEKKKIKFKLKEYEA